MDKLTADADETYRNDIINLFEASNYKVSHGKITNKISKASPENQRQLEIPIKYAEFDKAVKNCLKNELDSENKLEIDPAYGREEAV